MCQFVLSSAREEARCGTTESGGSGKSLEGNTVDGEGEVRPCMHKLLSWI